MRTRGGSSVAVLLAAALLALLTGCEATIASGLSESQANSVVVALDGQGIGATKAPGAGAGDGWDIRVPNDDVGSALSVLRAQGLPREPTPGLAEVFGEPTLVPTATEERARYVAAQSGELARSLEGMEGVLGARVHLAIPGGREIAFDAEPTPPSASVLLRTRAGASVDELAVQALVAGAVPELAPEGVAVVTVEVPQATPARASLVHVGPIAVTRGSAPILKSVLGGALGMSALLAIALIISWVRLRRPRADNETPGTQAA